MSNDTQPSLANELSWRGFIHQTTLKDLKLLDSEHYIFYLGIDPSADSMTVGHLAIIMLIRHLLVYGHQAILLAGGATGMIGDPDGRKTARQLMSLQTIEHNKNSIKQQFKQLLPNQDIQLVDNYDWFKDFNFLDFLREVGIQVPLSSMLSREFVKSRLGQDGEGITYAEFSYVLIQAYDFLYLAENYAANMQICGADQWGNCIAGVDLIRRKLDKPVEVLSAPLVVNPVTGVKFGKSEAGAIWLDKTKTSVLSFYQFWVVADDEALETYFKFYTILSMSEIMAVLARHNEDRQQRFAQKRLAYEVTSFVHTQAAADLAVRLSDCLSGQLELTKLTNEEINALKTEISYLKIASTMSLEEVLINTGLAQSKSTARKLISQKAIYLNFETILDNEQFIKQLSLQPYSLIRKGKAFKDSALLEVAN